MAGWAAFTAASVAGLLLAERLDSQLGKWLAKPLASTGFVAAAVAAGGTGSPYGALILIGLALSWLGDVLLIPKDRPVVFRAGVLSFLAGHVAYVVAFLARGVSPGAALAAAVILVAIGLPTLAWLRPHVPAEMKAAAYGYVVVISVMAACAVGASALDGRWSIAVGAWAFYASDLSVARDRFVSADFTNRLWGLPLYYGAQLVLAATIAPAVAAAA